MALGSNPLPAVAALPVMAGFEVLDAPLGQAGFSRGTVSIGTLSEHPWSVVRPPPLAPFLCLAAKMSLGDYARVERLQARKGELADG